MPDTTLPSISNSSELSVPVAPQPHLSGENTDQPATQPQPSLPLVGGCDSHEVAQASIVGAVACPSPNGLEEEDIEEELIIEDFTIDGICGVY